MYKEIQDRDGIVRNVIRENLDGSKTFIPFVQGNQDYEEYLKWLAEGNTPEPADQDE